LRIFSRSVFAGHDVALDGNAKTIGVFTRMIRSPFVSTIGWISIIFVSFRFYVLWFPSCPSQIEGSNWVHQFITCWSKETKAKNLFDLLRQILVLHAQFCYHFFSVDWNARAISNRKIPSDVH